MNLVIFLTRLCISAFHTVIIYIPAWILGNVLGIMIVYCIWCIPHKISSKIYLFFSGLSFIPVTILLPYFIMFFHLKYFIIPLLSFPVMIITICSSFEAFQHTNRHRITLLKNYEMKKWQYFWKVVFRESLPNMETTARQTLSLCFAIFLALDYFMQKWGGLGGMVQDYYSSYYPNSAIYMFITIAFSGAIGFLQIFLNRKLFKKWIEFRRHY